MFDNKRCGLVPWCAEQAAPCGNGGTCEELAGGFRCHCRPGYAGQRCQHDVDDCLAQPCLNGAVCHDGVNTFTCSCLGGFTGKNNYLPTGPSVTMVSTCSLAAVCILIGVLYVLKITNFKWYISRVVVIY